MHQPARAQEQSIALYQRYAPAVFAYLMRQVGSREDAEDLLLEVFLALVEKGPALQEDEHLVRAYIWSVAHHKVADHFRHFTRHPSIPLANVEEMLYERDERQPEQVALRREEYAQLYTLMRELPEPQREILQLRFGHELSYSEIAQIVAKSEAAVRMILHRALKVLRGAYSGKETGRSR
ncbi:RNA polymerase sigma24 factor [Ktedonobacter sp. SOSP1-85]|uniref:RNA polymerase sigma factor n=1 Tax=Ktedonobacter sp. SOSP1-85 TaxID=2778367 RepID=UPI001915320F|nr:sigma-70 family RNA polymerase sigma factor [Ktedonobacter sp. SOSP1-85]GHO80559.1 RNA polymerase sigma24 factor [Ktedonobacter sp. SOSP1-85]